MIKLSYKLNGGIIMKNIGKIDKVIRYILGVVLIALGIILQISTGGFWWLALIALVPIITASISICPIYLPFKISTVKK